MKYNTATEKLKAVNENKLPKGEFVRQMRLEFPRLITQFNGFNDTVQILKNKGLVFEKKSYDNKDNSYSFSDEACRRGTRYELQLLGHETYDFDTPDDIVLRAKERAINNLKKNPLHYINLISGESAIVDKNDKMKETKRGAGDKDTFNDLKKANLKEEAGVPTAFDDQSMDALLQIILKYVEDPDNAEKAVQQVDDNGLDSLSPELLANLDRDPEYKAWYNQLHNIKEADPIPTQPGIPGERTVNHDRKMAMRGCIDALTIHGHPDTGHKVSTDDALAFIRTHKDDIFSGDIDCSDPADVWMNYDEYETINRDDVSIDEEMSDAEMERIKNYNTPEDIVTPYKIGQGWSKNFDYEGMLETGLKIRVNTPVQTMQAIFDDFEDVNYHREGSHLSYAIDACKEGDKQECLDHLRNFKKEIKQTLLRMSEGELYERELDEADYNPCPQCGEKKHMLRACASCGCSENAVSEKKGKDHDGDGDVDGDDYMSAKDKAIKKAMGKDEVVRESLKTIITKILSEEAINEAATNKLADWGTSYESFPGVKPVVNDLENIVTEIEAFYDKIGEKIKNTFAKTADFQNDEGLKVGAFIAPSLEAAFKHDLRPVLKGGFTKKIELPKVRTISQAEIDAHNSGERPLGEIEAEPKQTVFSPSVNGTLRETKKK